MKRIWWHYQNLNERRDGSKGSILRHGRAWIHFGDNNCLGWSWHFFTNFCHARVDVGGWGCEEDFGLSLATPILATWIHVDRLWPKWLKRRFNEKRQEDMEISVSIHHWAIWWSLWHPVHSWSSRTPKWRHGNFNIPDFFLGRDKYSEREVSLSSVVVNMPEGEYRALVKMFESTWKRPRWFLSKKLLRADIAPEVPIPVPGKGENSWDIDDDAIHSMTCAAQTPEEAAKYMREECMRTRRKYGGTGWRPRLQVISNGD